MSNIFQPTCFVPSLEKGFAESFGSPFLGKRRDATLIGNTEWDKTGLGGSAAPEEGLAPG